jgi:hypothetical protein
LRIRKETGGRWPEPGKQKRKQEAREMKLENLMNKIANKEPKTESRRTGDRKLETGCFRHPFPASNIFNHKP